MSYMVVEGRMWGAVQPGTMQVKKGNRALLRSEDALCQ